MLHGVPEWQGWRAELDSALRIWRNCADNPLWILTRYMDQHSAPRRRRAARTNLLIWGSVLGLLYGSLLVIWASTASSLPRPEELYTALLVGVVIPLTFFLLHYCTGQIGFLGQQWLGRERGDARHVAAAMLDPLLGLTQLSPQEVVGAALRRHAGLVWLAAGSCALTVGLVTLGMALDGGAQPLGIITVLPLVIVGHFLAGLLGGTVLLLLSICLGLNSGSAIQRTALVFALVLHQLMGLFSGFSGTAVIEGSAGDPLSFLLINGAGYAYVLLACASGWLILTRVGSASSGWLLAAPLMWIGGAWLLMALLAMSNFLFASNLPWMEEVGLFFVSMLDAWSGINLFSMSNSILPFMLDSWQMKDSQIGLTIVHYCLRLLHLGLLLVLGYRSALYCAALRLRAAD